MRVRYRSYPCPKTKEPKQEASGVFVSLRDTTTESSGRDDGSKHPLRPSSAAVPLWWCNTQVTVCYLRWDMSQGAVINARTVIILSQNCLERKKKKRIRIHTIMPHLIIRHKLSVTDIYHKLLLFSSCLGYCVTHRRYCMDGSLGSGGWLQSSAWWLSWCTMIVLVIVLYIRCMLHNISRSAKNRNCDLLYCKILCTMHWILL